MNYFDPRIIRISLDISGRRYIYTENFMSASVTKYLNPSQNECSVKISNIHRTQREALLTEVSPLVLPRRRVKMIVEAGRKSTGYSRLFEGDITDATPTQPPDVVLNIKAKTMAFFKTDFISQSYPENISFSDVAGMVASSMDLSLQMEGTDKQIFNHGFSGNRYQQVNDLQTLTDDNVYIDDDRLVISSQDAPLTGVSHMLNRHTGLIGIPEMTESGVKVKYLFDPQSRIGGQIVLESEMNPAASGKYIISKLSMEVSNFDTSFYCIAECVRRGFYGRI